MTLPRGRGPKDAKIFIVGEAWGRQEEIAGKPFVGPAGNVLNELLLKAGINPDQCYYSNIINQRPPSNDLSAWFTKGVPNDLVLDGLSQLTDEINEVNPNVIVPLGNWPLWTFYGQKLNKDWVPTGILDYRGYVLEARQLARGRKVIPTVHPSYLLQGGSADAPLAILDLKRVNRESLFPDIRRKPRQAIIDPQGEEREAIRTRLLTEGLALVVDIEYIGSRLLCIGFAVSSDWAVTIRIRSPGDLAWCQSLIESGRPLCAQNSMFDLGILDWHYHIDAFKYLTYDTMVAAYVLNIEYKKDLGFLAGLYTDLPPWWDVIDWNAIKAGKQSLDEVWYYNCLDNMSTYEIMEKQEVELDSHPKFREAFTFDMSKIEPLWRMSRRGVPIDSDKLRDIRFLADVEQSEAQAALNSLADALGINLKGLDLNVKSTPQVANFLEAMGVQLTRRTPPSKIYPKGQLKTDNITLMECARNAKHPSHAKAIELIVRCREARDLISKTLDIEWDDDDRARCIYDCTKTTTRRLSSKTFFPTGKGSNLQNTPAPGSNRYGKAVRGCFKADPGYEFGYSDLKGAEFLIVAELTQDPLMLEFAEMSITGKGNVHKETASRIFHVPASEVQKDTPQYFLGKKMRHSGNYMIGWKELMGRINAEATETGVYVTAAETKKLIEAYLRMHPELPVWWREVETEVRMTGRLSNLFGYIRVFHGHISQLLPKAVAFKPQSTVGDLLNFGLVACANDPQLNDAGFQLLLNVHDAIGYQYPIQNRDEVVPRVNELMSIPIPIPKTGKNLIIPIETAIGPTWGDLEEWKAPKVLGEGPIKFDPTFFGSEEYYNDALKES